MEQVFLYNKILSHCTSEFSPIILGGLKIHPVVFHFTKEKEKKTIPVHQHRFAELSWMIAGSMGYKIGNKLQIITSESRNIIFIPPKTDHQRIPQVKTSNILGLLLDLTPHNETGKLFYDAIVKFLAGHDYTLDNPDFLNEFEPKLMKELRAGDSVFIGKINFYIYEFLFKLFSHYFAVHLIQNNNTHKMSYDRDDLVVAVKQTIEERLSSPISLNYLAKRFNVSVRHLNRIFCEQTACSPGNYIIQRKLNAAQKMLYNPKFSVKEISDSLGFKRDSYFCHFFKKHTGLTPLEYARKANKS
jgi:AraC-like DNA-binding protein